MVKEKKNILITGCAGFIGAALCKRFLRDGHEVFGIDNLNNYYDVKLKKDRLKNISEFALNNKCKWTFDEISIEERVKCESLFLEIRPNIVVNLAAQAGVRYSITNPTAYFRTNLGGFFNILDLCRLNNVEHLVYASSSSVYGASLDYPFSEEQKTNEPLSFYASTKKSNEMIAHSFSNIYKIPITGLRFFTVYGPWGRPDMAPMIFAKNITSKIPISIFNNGEMSRDFTYIDDIVEGTYLCSLKAPSNHNKKFEKHENVPHEIFNIGYGSTINLLDFINLLEDALNIKAIKVFEPMQKGDVVKTYANINKLNEWVKFKPKVSIDKGVKYFANWYLNYFA
jgi:UDP-glucuronate 4-epimerase